MKLRILSNGQDERILAETLLIVGNGKEHTTNEKVSFLGLLFCTTLLCIFIWTKLSLNGYRADFYFFLATLLLNLLCFGTLFRTKMTKHRSLINLSLAALQIIGLCIFLRADTLQVNKIYEPKNNKYNLYSSLSGWYKRAYFKQHQVRLCHDGELWETKVPYYFPLIEIETSRDPCHKVGTDSSYLWLYRHVPE